MNILLLVPNIYNRRDAGNMVSTVPLGLLYIASALRRAGYDRINILDARVRNLDCDEISERIKDLSPTIVGISGMSLEAEEVHQLALLVKRADTHCKVVIGGAYATTSPEVIIEDPNVDFVVVGEGESTACELIAALENGSDLAAIDGLVFRNGSMPVFNPRRPPIEDINSISFPAWDLLDTGPYFNPARRQAMSLLLSARRVVQIFTSRGCPYGCIYCHNIFGKQVRLRSVENVLHEIELLVEMHAPEEIEIVDDIFNFDLERAKQICDEIVKRGIKITLSFPNALRVDRMDKELIAKLKAAGTQLIFYAIESASPEVQGRIGKHLNLDTAREIIRLTAQSGIITCGYFMLGFPEETEEEMRKTIAFAKELPFHIVNFFYVTPRQNTPLQTLLQKKNIVLENIHLHHYMAFSINLSAMPDMKLKQMWARAHAEFYLRPTQMWRIWKALPDKWYVLKAFSNLISHFFPDRISSGTLDTGAKIRDRYSFIHKKRRREQ